MLLCIVCTSNTRPWTLTSRVASITVLAALDTDVSSVALTDWSVTRCDQHNKHFTFTLRDAGEQSHVVCKASHKKKQMLCEAPGLAREPYVHSSFMHVCLCVCVCVCVCVVPHLH